MTDELKCLDCEESYRAGFTENGKWIIDNEDAFEEMFEEFITKKQRKRGRPPNKHPNPRSND